MDFDTAGAGVQGALLGGALERPTGHGGEAHNVCADCGTELVGQFCHQCGQPAHIHRSLLHLGEELLHGVMHFDGRIWRTLPLLAFRPGRLTREWVFGKRSRYVSPLAMFLFTVFLMFFVISFGLGGGGADVTSNMSEADRAALAADLQTARDEIAASAGPESNGSAEKVGGAAITAVEKGLGVIPSAPVAKTKRTDGFKDGSWQAAVHDAAASGQLKPSFGDEHLNEKITKKLLNPDLAVYKIQQTAYKFSFLLIPISIPFVALLFLWRRGFTLYDHGVFVLYSLTAVSILAMLVSIVAPLGGAFTAVLATLAWMTVPVHMFAQLKGAYGLSWFSAGWRTFVLLNFCIFAFTLFLLAIITLGLTG